LPDLRLQRPQAEEGAIVRNRAAPQKDAAAAAPPGRWTGLRKAMLDHVSLGVRDLERSRRFYDAALRALGIVRIVDFQQRGSDYGTMAGPLGVEFTITLENDPQPSSGLHLCFRAPDRAAVEAFHTAALRSGGRDDAAPGLRPEYHPDYFAAFVLDPDGHRVEALCHAPQRPAIQ
jgi:catechol 2,3-dioxygenase-like lactoylglutathione lyase family enzyme